MRTGRLSFGEKMHEWRKARKEYAKQVKEKLKEQQEIKDRYPEQATMEELKSMVTSPEETTESKVGEVGPIPNPTNPIERAINHLREKAKRL